MDNDSFCRVIHSFLFHQQNEMSELVDLCFLLFPCPPSLSDSSFLGFIVKRSSYSSDVHL